MAEDEGRMRWRVMVELSGANGSVQTPEVHVGGCSPAACSVETLGLILAQVQTAAGRLGSGVGHMFEPSPNPSSQLAMAA